jgi:hypothetical protein
VCPNLKTELSLFMNNASLRVTLMAATRRCDVHRNPPGCFAVCEHDGSVLPPQLAEQVVDDAKVSFKEMREKAKPGTI